MLFSYGIGLAYLYPAFRSWRSPLLCRQLRRVVDAARRDVALYRGLYPDNVSFSSLEEFARQVPVTDKEVLFGKGADAIPRMLAGGGCGGVSAVLSSSGTTGKTLSFGMVSDAERKAGVKGVDDALCRILGADRKRTLLLLCLPGGVSVETHVAVVVSAGTRLDLASRYLNLLSPQFDQTLIIAEPPFAKRLIETMSAEKYPWQARGVHVLVGGDYVAENLRSHLAAKMGLDLSAKSSERQFLVTMGLGEVGLNIFHETWEVMRIRRFLQGAPESMANLCGVNLPTVPLLFFYDPRRVYVESVGEELVLTLLDADKIQPIIRYNTHDRGGIIPAARVAEVLRAAGQPDLIPSMPLDMVWVYGRNRGVQVGAKEIAIPQVMEALFSKPELIPLLTGAFHAAGDGNTLHVDVQCNSEAGADWDAGKVRLQMESELGVKVELVPFSWRDYPHARFALYESKFQYIY